jgi:hypothetical protein
MVLFMGVFRVRMEGVSGAFHAGDRGSNPLGDAKPIYCRNEAALSPEPLVNMLPYFPL